VTLGVIGLVAAYVLVVVLLLALCLSSRWSWQVKAGGIIVASLFYVVTYVSLPRLLGWPISRDPPRHFQLVGAHVEQPSKKLRSKGSIYLWLLPYDPGGAATPVPPRAYRLPYSNPTHELVNRAIDKMGRGLEQVGEFREPPEGALVNVEDPTRLTEAAVPIDLYDMPDDLFPVDK